MLPSHDLPLRGRTAPVTGVSRRRGIGCAGAAHLARLGADVFIHHYAPHDDDQPWGGDDLDAVRDGLRAELTPGAGFGELGAGLRVAASCSRVVAETRALTGRLDILVCNHALSGGDGSILDVTAERLDAFWQTNARSTILLTREFAALHAGDGPGARPGERVARRGIQPGR